VSRPWSDRELAEKIPEAVARKEALLTELKRLGELAANAKWTFERAKSVAWVRAIDHFNGTRSAKEEREAWVMQYVDPRTEMDVLEYGLAKDLADHAYRDTRTVIDSIDTDLRIMQTLIVSARAVA
jgi:acyl-CoA thioesterase